MAVAAEAASEHADRLAASDTVAGIRRSLQVEVHDFQPGRRISYDARRRGRRRGTRPPGGSTAWIGDAVSQGTSVATSFRRRIRASPRRGQLDRRLARGSNQAKWR